MKAKLIYFLSGIILMFLISAGYENYVVSKQTANAERYQNVYVFTDSKPVMEYEYLGTVKVKLGITGYYDETRDILIKNAKKEYPQLDAIIIREFKADVIKFK